MTRNICVCTFAISVTFTKNPDHPNTKTKTKQKQKQKKTDNIHTFVKRHDARRQLAEQSTSLCVRVQAALVMIDDDDDVVVGVVFFNLFPKCYRIHTPAWRARTSSSAA
jgi:prolyl-tRNA synthetase